MNLEDAILSGRATKHVEEPIAGTYVVSRPNLSPGFLSDFKPDDPARRSNFDTSSLYSGEDPLADIASFAGDDGWSPQNKKGQQA